jgi:hypothetical protein
LEGFEQTGERVGFAGRHVREQTGEPLAQACLSRAQHLVAMVGQDYRLSAAVVLERGSA